MYTIAELFEKGAENRDRVMTRSERREQSKVFHKMMATVSPIVIKKKGE